jgi:hypothetical protein
MVALDAAIGLDESLRVLVKLRGSLTRAALALTDAVTLVADGHVPDEIWQEARGRTAHRFGVPRDRTRLGTACAYGPSHVW